MVTERLFSTSIGRSEKLPRDAQEFGHPRIVDRDMVAIGDDPQLRPGDRPIHLDRDRDRKKFVAIAVDDQGARLDCRELGRSEIHILMAVLEAAELAEQITDLPSLREAHLPNIVNTSLGKASAFDPRIIARACSGK